MDIIINFKEWLINEEAITSKYTFEELQNLAKKYTTFDEFKEGNYEAWKEAKKLGLMRKLGLIKQHPKYTFDTLKKLAKDYTTFEDFEEGNHDAWKEAKKRGLLRKLGLIKRSASKYTLEKLKELSKGCVTYADFKAKDRLAYANAKSNNLLPKLGLTKLISSFDWDLEKLKKAAEGYTTLKEFMIGNKTAYYAAKKLKLRNKLGLLVKPSKYNLENLKELSKNCTTYEQFNNLNVSAYNAAARLGLLDKLGLIHTPSKYDLKTLKELCKDYVTYREFQKGNPNAYGAALRNKLLHKLGLQRMKRPKWSVSKLIKYVINFETKQALYKADVNALTSLYMRGLVYDIYGPGKTVWNDKRIELLASNCTSLKNFENRCPIAFKKAKEFGLLDILPILFKNKPKKDWTYEELVEEAKKFNTRTEFRKKSPYAVDAAEEMGVYNEITQHMKKTPADNVNKYTIFKMTFPDGITHYARSSTLNEKSDYKGYCVSQSKNIEYNYTFLKKVKETNPELLTSEVLFTKLNENESLKKLEELISNDTDSINKINYLKQHITDYDKASPIHIPKGEFFKDKENIYWVKESYYLLNNKKPTEKDTDAKLKSLKDRVDNKKYLIINNIKYLRIKASNLVVEIEKELKNKPKDLSIKPKVVEKDLSKLLNAKPGEFSKIAKEYGIGENLVFKFSDLF